MDKVQAINLLTKQIDSADSFKHKERFSSDFKAWHRSTQIIIQKIFGDTSRHIKDFGQISYSLSFSSNLTTDYERQEKYECGIDDAKSILQSMIEEIKQFGLTNKEITSSTLDILDIIKRICNRFHLVSRQLRVRHQNRNTIEIEDEYDTQDLFHALLHLFFDDIRAEEWTPSYAGKASRTDFLLKNEECVVEIKKTRPSLKPKDLADELIIDIQRYKVHPNCKSLICFVYDPEGRVGNPIGLENDLSDDSSDFKVQVIVTPKGI